MMGYLSVVAKQYSVPNVENCIKPTRFGNKVVFEIFRDEGEGF
jgi:hypothetical protein